MANIINVLAALGQQTRLDVLSLLSRGSSVGQTSGGLAMRARVPANSMSTHLAILAAAGLVSATRSGRQVFYRIETAAIESALEILATRLTDEPALHHVRHASSVTVAPPVADPHPVLQRKWRWETTSRWPAVVIRGLVGNGTDDPPGYPFRALLTGSLHAMTRAWPAAGHRLTSAAGDLPA